MRESGLVQGMAKVCLAARLQRAPDEIGKLVKGFSCHQARTVIR